VEAGNWEVNADEAVGGSGKFEEAETTGLVRRRPRFHSRGSGMEPKVPDI
jgi:hypothetical protein